MTFEYEEDKIQIEVYQKTSSGENEIGFATFNSTQIYRATNNGAKSLVIVISLLTGQEPLIDIPGSP
jgi:hypothetical protein